jgi:hypothetical protein
MICPMPNTHDPNPTAVPIAEAIKETFRVLMAILNHWIRRKPQFRSLRPDFVVNGVFLFSICGSDLDNDGKQKITVPQGSNRSQRGLARVRNHMCGYPSASSMSRPKMEMPLDLSHLSLDFEARSQLIL